MDSSNIDGSINETATRSGGSGSYQEAFVSSSVDHLPSYLPTFRSSSATEPPSSPSSPPPCTTTTTRSASKKRPRASRRAPTTVLTTDTSNFRAMVQEFTGFPTPPFPSSSSSSPFIPRPPLLHPSSPSSFLSIPSSQNILVDAIASTVMSINGPHIGINSAVGYPFLNPTMVGVHSSSSNPILSAAPQFGDLRTSSLQHQQVRLGGLPSWQEQSVRDQSSRRDGDHDQLRPEKRQKTSDGIDPWVLSSD